MNWNRGIVRLWPGFRPIAVATIAAFALIAWSLPAPAGATLTLGSPMTLPSNASFGCLNPTNCTFSQTVFPGRVVTSPVNGTVSAWRVGWTGPGLARLRVTRPMGANTLFVSSSAPSPQAVAGGLNQFSANLPIAIGDGIGVDDLGTGTAQQRVPIDGARTASFDPALADGASGPPQVTFIDAETYLSAEIEPTNTLTATAKPTKKGTSVLTARLPNPGTVSVGPAAAANAGRAGAAAARSPVKTAVKAAAGPGDLQLTLRPTKRSKKRLGEKGKAAGPVTLSYTPSFGIPSTQTLKIKLKLKR
jgi:hypothetical protein